MIRLYFKIESWLNLIFQRPGLMRLIKIWCMRQCFDLIQVYTTHMTFIFHSYENRIEPVEIQPQNEKTIKELYERLVQELDFESELDYSPKVEDIIIVYKQQPTKRVQPEQLLSQLIQGSNNESLQLMVVYPSEQGGALIEFLVEGKECYFETIVNKNDPLENYIQILLKKLGLEEEVQIKINGKTSSLDNQIEKKLIRKLISGKSGRVLVQISKVRSRMLEKNGSSMPKIKLDNKLQAEKQIPLAVQVSLHLSPAKKEAIHPMGGVGVGISPQLSPQKSIIKPGNQEPIIQVAKVQQQRSKILAMQQGPAQSKIRQDKQKQILKFQPENKIQQLYTFLISFQTDNGKRSHAVEVKPTETMLDILPRTLLQLCHAGFDWDLTWKDYFPSKLVIFYGSNNVQFTKYDKKFYQILLTSSSTHQFEFKRRYQGG